jgi:hypothetical protein
MKTKTELIQEFSEMGTRVALSMQDGRYMEGYILGISEGKFEFASGGPMAPEESSWFVVDDVDFDSLSFFSEARQRYMEARWESSTDSWRVFPR